MTHFYRLLICFCLLIIVGSNAALMAQQPPTQGGPDAFGYTWRSSLVTGGPAFEWVDIREGSTTAQRLSDDNFIGPVRLGFRFKYFWNEYDEVYIGSNGYVMFGKGMNLASDLGGFPEFPTEGSPATVNNHIGLFVTDLTFEDGNHNPVTDAKVYYKTVDKKFIVTYENVPFWVRSIEDPREHRGACTFQLILDGNDHSFRINYKSIIGDVSASYTNARPVPKMGFITAGFENATGRIGQNFFTNYYPRSNVSIAVTYPAQTNFQVTDMQVDWILNEDVGGVIKLADRTPYYVTASVRNVGTRTIDSQVNNGEYIEVVQRVFDFANGNSLQRSLSDTVVVNKLNAGESRLITFNKPFIPTEKGNYRVQIDVNLRGATGNNADTYLANNALNAELNITDRNSDFTTLFYDKMHIRGINEWTTADGIITTLKVGTYFRPPYYPFVLTDLEFGMFVAGNGAKPDTLVGFTTEVYDDDGFNGSPGTRLDSITVFQQDLQDFFTPDLAEDVFEVFDFSISLTKPVVIRDGGFYVSWEQNKVSEEVLRGSQDALLTEEGIGIPVSFHTYEIKGDIWAPYRGRSNTDFLIRALSNNRTNARPALGSAAHLGLGQPYPNPTSGIVTFPFSVTKATTLSLEVRDALGRTVYSSEPARFGVGNHTLTADTQNLPAGMYFCTVNTGSEGSKTVKITVTKN